MESASINMPNMLVRCVIVSSWIIGHVVRTTTSRSTWCTHCNVDQHQSEFEWQSRSEFIMFACAAVLLVVKPRHVRDTLLYRAMFTPPSEYRGPVFHYVNIQYIQGRPSSR